MRSRGEMNSYRSEISNRCENKFCSHEVSFRLHFKTTPYFDGYVVGLSFRVVFTYFITRNEISFLSKWPIWNPYPHWVNKRTCALNATSNESVLTHFVLGKYVPMKISYRFEISFRSKWPIWNPYRFEFHFASIHGNTSRELTASLLKISLFHRCFPNILLVKANYLDYP